MDRPAGGSRPSGAAGRLTALSRSAWFAYGSIAALQLRTVWEFWAGRDLPTGDTSGYFTVARVWAESFTNIFFWSPLYTAYYGTLLKLTGSPVTATLLHRLVLVFVLTMLVLSLARRLLPPPAAWLVAAWWAILPINFDTLYEVHLFGAIPAFAAALVAGRWPGHRGRAAVLAILGTAAVLVRNEYGFAALLFLIVCGWALVTEARRSPDFRPGLAARPYLVAAALAFALIGLFYARSSAKGSLLLDLFNDRRTQNFCQAYAFNYSQRNPDWPGNPFVDCGELVQQAFQLEPGVSGDSIGFLDGYRWNPDRVREYLAWNLRLIPSGLQLALFNGISGSVTPDYVDVARNQTLPWVLTIAWLSLLLGGAWGMYQETGFWPGWWRDRRWPLAVLACCAVGVALVMVQQRPRPSYMFPLTFGLMAATGLCVWVLVHRASATALVAAGVPLLFVLLLALAPTPYIDRQTPLADAYRRLEPHAADLAGRKVAVPAYSVDLCRYLALDPCDMIDYWVLRPAVEAGSMGRALDAAEVDAVYADADVLADALASGFLADPGPGWTRLAGRDGRWVLLVRDRPADAPA